MGQIKKLHRAHVTPKDTTDINQLVSLSQGLRNIYPSDFKVGQRCLYWFPQNSYCPEIDVGNDYERDFWCPDNISVNELARQLALWT